MQNLKRVAIIPARGGSKRFPGKNVVDLFGRPIIAYTIEAALQSGMFDRVVCSSDDPAILDVAAACGAEPILRRQDMAEDHVATAPVLLDFLDQEESAGRSYDVLCCLYATAALRTAEDIRAIVNLIEPGSCEFAMGVSQADRQAHQALRAHTDGTLTAMFPDLVNRQSQDIGPLWFSNGTSYALEVPAFRKHKTLYGPTLKGHFMPRERAVDLDEPEDLDLLKYYFAKAREQGDDRRDLLDVWRGAFGQSYIKRNAATPDRIQARQEMWRRILSSLPRPVESILEVGANIGLNLRALKTLTTATLSAVEPNRLARETLIADDVLPAERILDGSAMRLPVADGAAELVFTCGVLIHVHPDDLRAALAEIHRASGHYILCLEYFAPEPEAIPYRGQDGMLFRNDYGRRWLDSYPGLRLVDYGFFWREASQIGNLTWWLFEK